MESVTSPPEQEAFRFLDLPPELRLMVYEHLVGRRRQLLGRRRRHRRPSPVLLIIPDQIPPIHATCRLLYAEAGPFLRKIASINTVPRVIAWVDSEGFDNSDEFWSDLIKISNMSDWPWGFGGIVPNFHRYPIVERWRDKMKSQQLSREKNSGVITRSSRLPLEYTDRLCVPPDLYGVHIAVRGTGVSDQNKLRELLDFIELSIYHTFHPTDQGPVVTIYTMEFRARATKLGSQRKWVKYGGYIDRKTWRKDWADWM